MLLCCFINADSDSGSAVIPVIANFNVATRNDNMTGETGSSGSVGMSPAVLSFQIHCIL